MVDTTTRPQPLQNSSDQEILTAAKGSGITFIGTMLEYAVRFVLGIALARFLGGEQYGLYSLADSAVYMLIGISLLGFDTALMHFIPIFQNRGDEKALKGALRIGLTLPTAVSLGAGLGLFAFAAPLSEILFHEPRLTPLLRVVALAVPFGTLASAAVGATRGFKKMQYKVIAQDIIQTLLKLALVILLALTGLTAIKAMSAYTIAMVVSCLLLIYFLNRLSPLQQTLGTGWAHLKQMFSFSVPIYLSRLLAIFGPNLRTLFLGVFSNVLSVGVFTAAMRIRMVSVAFQSAMVVMASPLVSEMHGQGDLNRLKRFYQTMTKWTLTFNLPLFLAIFLFARPLLSIFGQEFTDGTAALLILAGGDLINAATGICGVVVTMTGNPWLNTVNSILALTITLLLSVWLIPSLGAVGAGIAATASMAASNLFQLIAVFVLHRLLPYNRSFWKPILAGLIAATAAWIVSYGVLARVDLLSALLGGTILLAVYAAAIWLLGLSDEDRLILDRLYNRVRQAGPGKSLQ